ncbi:phosphopentomutase [Cyclonatronum proteinivorum]|uniref:Phosphopentomutase n=1 Tax=Cyclonatronum proteinivorum TaxID=1457365 RepID=A0A345UN30_9BACT|nr:phosphopentomutase [Cyclonatronum proteinivorum]AXJ01882.1 phosphopentomutase [Cyclonatronum proteinivorum]
MSNFYLIIIDGLGCGHQEDAADYGDLGSNTLGHVIAETKVGLPNFTRLGLGNIIPLDTVPPVHDGLCGFGKMREVSGGKDSTTGHWEIAGIQLPSPFPTYPKGFPAEITEAFAAHTGTAGVLANKPYSGTDVIRDYGDEHLQSGKPIVYTSADSVFQVATHTDIVPLEKLYDWCTFARDELMTGAHSVGRVIARPFAGQPGAYFRLTDHRKDFSLVAPEPNIMSELQRAGIKTYSIGKIVDLFGGVGFTQYRKTNSNAEGISQLLSIMHAVENSFVFVNLIDTDQLFGHRNDPAGFAGSLEEFDRAIPAIFGNLREDDVLVITADHGNDPTMASTDHSREFVPLLVYGKSLAGKTLGTRESFTDVAAAVMDWADLQNPFKGQSFLNTP